MIDEPEAAQFMEGTQRTDQWIVKIGVIDEGLAMLMPFPKKDFQDVVHDLRSFLESEGVMEE